MTVNRTTLLDLPLPVTGTESGTWGDTTNNGLTQYMDIAIAGMSNLTSANFTTGALTIETTEGNSSATNISATSAQYAGFRVTSLAQNSTITVGNTGTNPARSYRLINADATYTLTFKATGQTGITLQPGQTAVVAFNGTDYVIVGMAGAGTVTDNAVVRFDGTTGKLVQNSVVTIADSTGDVAGVGALTASGNLTLSGGTANGVLYLNGSKVATSGSAVTYNGTTFATSADASISGLTVGKGAGSVSTNTAVGASALAANTTGSYSTAIGAGALAAQNGNVQNVAVGNDAAGKLTTGNQNTAVGISALGWNAGAATTGDYNAAFGQSALTALTSGSYNVAVGSGSLQANTTASNNTAVGYQAGYNANRTADASGFNSLFGYIAGKNISTGQVNVFIGSRSGSNGASALTGSANTVVGDFAGNALEGAANTNAFFGQNSGYAITTGSKNTIIGSYGGNQGGLDIRTASNYIVLSDGDGNPRAYADANGTWTMAGGVGAVRGSLAVANTTWTTLIDAASYGDGAFSVFAYIDDYVSSDWSAFGVVLYTGNTTMALTNYYSTGVQLRVSGTNIQVYHGGGAGITINYRILRVA